MKENVASKYCDYKFAQFTCDVRSVHLRQRIWDCYLLSDPTMTDFDYVDAHFHVWELERFQYPWPTPDMRIYKNYFPCGIETASQSTPVRHGVFVQCLHSVEEAEWVMDMATRHPFIAGVVAGLDLADSKLEENIIRLKKNEFFKGVRFILDFVEDDWLVRDDVNRGLDLLEKHNLTFDLLVRPKHLKYALDVVTKHPNLQFVVDHIAKPPYTTGKLEGWDADMAALAKHPNVYCKISGLISEMEPEVWKNLDFKSFVQHVLNVFGPDRCMFASDWPVLQTADSNYAETLALIDSCLGDLDPQDRRKIFRENAINFYKLKV